MDKNVSTLKNVANQVNIKPTPEHGGKYER